MGFGAIDSYGLRHFSGKGLAELNAQPRAVMSRGVSVEPKVDLFSVLNQWLIKVLLAPYLNDRHRLNAPIGEHQNATQLAAAGGVSVMTAFRFLRELRAEGFLQDARSGIRVVRVEELLRRWGSSATRRVPEVRGRWILPADPNRVKKALHAARGTACVALFAAAEALGLGFVHGAVTHIYVRDLHTADLRKMGVLRTEPGQSFDVVVRSAAARESVFRGAVEAEGLSSCDVLQVWLDVSIHPSRGLEQAERIYTRALKPMIKRANDAGR